MNTQDLVRDLKEELNRQSIQVQNWLEYGDQVLDTRPSPDSWSVAEIAQHLLHSSGHYERELRNTLMKNAHLYEFNPKFQPGFWGERGTRMMQPKKSGKIPWKMPTLERFKPENASRSDVENLHKMIDGLYELLDRYGLETDLNAILVPSTLGSWLRFRAGDAFRFAIAHNKRHLVQGERVLEKLWANSEKSEW